MMMYEDVCMVHRGNTVGKCKTEMALGMQHADDWSSPKDFDVA